MRQFSRRLPLFLFFILSISACGGIQLIDIPKSIATLNLSEEQREMVYPKFALIRDIVEDYNFEKGELVADYHRYRSNVSTTRLSRYEGGGPNREIYRERNTLRTEIRNFVRQRKEFIKEISKLVEEIRGNLSSEQLVAFEKIKLPELEFPEMLRRRPYDEFLFIPGSRMGRPDDF